MNIKEVARVAGVSVTTVSRVLNHPELVEESTRAHILSVMEKLDYRPNWFARNLNLKKNSTLAIMIPGIENRMYQGIIDGVEQIAYAKQYSIFMCITRNDPKRELRFLDMIQERKIAGLILASSALEKDWRKILKLLIPFVFIGKDPRFSDRDNCFIDFEEAAFRMTNHLLDMNADFSKSHRFQLILDQHSLSRVKNIHQGTAKALEGRGISPPQVFRIPNDSSAAMLLAKKLIQEGQLGRILLCTEDEQALGILKACQDMQWQVPSQSAVAGMSNSVFGRLSEPELSSMDQPAKKLGMVAARMLFDRLENVSQPYQSLALNCVMKIRRSCGNRRVILELSDV